MSTLTEQVAALTKRLDFITGVVREELVRRAANLAHQALANTALAKARAFPVNSSLRDGANAVWVAVRDADLSKVVPAMTAQLADVSGEAGHGDVRKLVQQLADARAEVKRLDCDIGCGCGKHHCAAESRCVVRQRDEANELLNDVTNCAREVLSVAKVPNGEGLDALASLADAVTKTEAP